MSFAPVLPSNGYTGWLFLKRTIDKQQATFVQGAAMQRDEAYFRDRIASVGTAEELVSDRRLLKVALGAFGLDDDINNRYFLQRVLADGTTAKGALSSKLADKAYARLSAAFGFGDGGVPLTRSPGFADRILQAYESRQFERAVGERNDNMRLALNAERELSALAARGSSDDTKWLTVMGSGPLREVFEKALGLPSGFAALDLDQQLTTLRSKSKAQLGEAEIGQFTDPDRIEALVRRFLIRAEASGAAPANPAAGALMILRGGGAKSSYSLLSALYS